LNRYLPVFFLCFLFSCKPDVPATQDLSATQIPAKDTLVSWERKKTLKPLLDSVFAETQFNGIISVYRESEKFYEKSLGFEDFRTKEQLDSNSVFAIGSVSKQFAGAIILLLEEKGKLRTSDRISKYLPEYRSKTFEDITIHHLLTHTSGISDLGPGLQSEPGAEFNYSNKGYRLLGEIAEAASGKSYDANARELFAKAGLTATYTAENFTGKNLAGAHTGPNSNTTPVPNMPQRLAHGSISTAAGGLLSTVYDLHRWNYELYSGKILAPVSLQKFLKQSANMNHPILGSVGYGYGIMLSAAPQTYLHSGYVKGSPSLTLYYPQSRTSVVILSNTADTGKGKKAIFRPHTRVKQIVDSLEVTWKH